MPIQLPVIALLAILAAIIDGCSSQDVTDVPEGKEDETKDELKKKPEKVDEPCVCDACVMCKSATAASRPVHIKRDGGTIEVGDRSKLNEKDITLEEPFEGCTLIGKCIVSESVIENQEWMDTDINRDNGQRSLNYLTSYMICTAGPGLIYFTDAGQNLKSFINELETDEIELLELAQLIKFFEIGDIYNINNNYIGEPQAPRGTQEGPHLSRETDHDPGDGRLHPGTSRRDGLPGNGRSAQCPLWHQLHQRPDEGILRSEQAGQRADRPFREGPGAGEQGEDLGRVYEPRGAGSQQEDHLQAGAHAPQRRRTCRDGPAAAWAQGPARLPSLLLAEGRGAERLEDEARHRVGRAQRSGAGGLHGHFCKRRHPGLADRQPDPGDQSPARGQEPAPHLRL